MRALMFPGDFASDLIGLDKKSDHRQIFRMFVNTVVWSLAGVLIVVISLTN